ncbi:hypothetical protein D3C72_1639520 [compost metagenome]
MTVVRLDNFFEFTLLRRQFVEVSIRFSVLRVHLIQTFQRVNDFGNGFFDGFANGVFRV